MEQLNYDVINGLEDIVKIYKEYVSSDKSIDDICSTYSYRTEDVAKFINWMTQLKSEHNIRKENYETLYYDIFEGEYEMPSDYVKTVDYLLSQMSNEKKISFIYFYALNGGKRMTKTSIAKLLYKSVTTISSNISNGYRFLRKAENKKILEMGIEAYTYEKDCENSLQEEKLAAIKDKYDSAIELLKNSKDELTVDEAKSTVTDMCKSICISEIGLDVRGYNALSRCKCCTLYDIITMGYERIKDLRNVGNATFCDIKNCVKNKVESTFGMSVEELEDVLFSEITDDNSILVACKRISINSLDIPKRLANAISRFTSLYFDINKPTLYDILNPNSPIYKNNVRLISKESKELLFETVNEFTIRRFRKGATELTEMFFNN